MTKEKEIRYLYQRKPISAQMVSQFEIFNTLTSAVFGTWIYAYFRDKLPH
jgi:hypothetical protein